MGQYMAMINASTYIPKSEQEKAEIRTKSLALGDLFHKRTNKPITDSLGHDDWFLTIALEKPDLYFVKIKTKNENECDIICSILKTHFTYYNFDYKYEGSLI